MTAARTIPKSRSIQRNSMHLSAQRMTHITEHDILTSLPNRALLDDRLEQGIALAQRYSRRLAVLSIDLDHFKHINDSVGHRVYKTCPQRRSTGCKRASLGLRSSFEIPFP